MGVRSTAGPSNEPADSSPSTEDDKREYQSSKPSGAIETNVDPLWTILPSYHMYYALYRGIRMSDDDDGNQDLPPVYHRSSISTSSTVSNVTYQMGVSTSSQDTSVAQSVVSADSSSHEDGENSRYILADELSNWQETILDNTQLLKNLTETTNADSNAISIKIHFTKDICQAGEKPVEIDPTYFEYKQGDYLNGYIIIQNTSDKPIPFEMFYLVFEGTMKVVHKNTRKYKHSRNFLQMFDFSGSWNDGHINRLITEPEGGLKCTDLRDPMDGTYLSFAHHKEIQPNRTYKRFFTFKIPNVLLDTECSEHNISTHIQLPPSMGRSMFEEPRGQTMSVKDFSPQDSAITYGVLARFVGRKSRHNVDESFFKGHDVILVNSKGDEFLILKEEYNHVRILQQTKVLNKNKQAMKFMESKLVYENLRNRINEKIESGKQLLESLKKQQIDNAVMRRFAEIDIELSKRRQSYRSSVRDIKHLPKSNDEYAFVYPLTKKVFPGSVRNLGTLHICTPKVEYRVKYIPPIQFRSSPLTQDDVKSWTLRIPFDLTYFFPHLNEECDSKNIPKIKSVKTDLVVLTLKSDQYPIPIEFHHDLIFQSRTNTIQKTRSFQDSDTFENNVISSTKALSNELYHVAKELGDNFKIDKQLVDDIRSICELESKNINLSIRDLKVKTDINTSIASPNTVESIPWKQNGNSQYCKSFSLILNLESARLKSLEDPKTNTKAYDSFCLVPNFQYCRLARLYFIRVSIGFTNNQIIHVKLPVSIQK